MNRRFKQGKKERSIQTLINAIRTDRMSGTDEKPVLFATKRTKHQNLSSPKKHYNHYKLNWRAYPLFNSVLSLFKP